MLRVAVGDCEFRYVAVVGAVGSHPPAGRWEKLYARSKGYRGKAVAWFGVVLGLVSAGGQSRESRGYCPVWNYVEGALQSYNSEPGSTFRSPDHDYS